MRGIAREMNLSETAFLYPEEDGFNLRWFTPTTEVNLCGHATLAGAHILWETETLKIDQEARFHTKSGLLTAVKRADWYELNFPVKRVEACEPPQTLTQCLGIEPVFAGNNRLTYLFEVANEEMVRKMDPDFNAIKVLPTRAVIVTSRSATAEFDFVSRYFAPGIGINEDPATGSSHCYLAHYWAGRLNKTSFMAYQASSRGGVLRVTLEGDRVLLGGQCVTILKGEIKV